MKLPAELVKESREFSNKMDLKKEYINQALTTASHNLRLTSEKIEVIAILKEYISNNEHVSDSIVEMKKTIFILGK